MDFYKIEIVVDPPFVNVCMCCKTKCDVTEANRDVIESSVFYFETHAIMRWFANF